MPPQLTRRPGAGDSRGSRPAADDWAGLCSSYNPLGEVTHSDFTQYPNVARWYASMKALPNWAKASEAFYGMVNAKKDAAFVTI
jgi:glutathione S-transferase